MLGFPIRKSPDQRSVANSPGHIAGSHVLHRLLVPRHPPCALKNLNTHYKQEQDARVHYAVLKTRTEPTPSHHQTTNPDKKPSRSIRYGDQISLYRTKPPKNGGFRPEKPRCETPVPSGPNSVPKPTDHNQPRSHSQETPDGTSSRPTADRSE